MAEAVTRGVMNGAAAAALALLPCAPVAAADIGGWFAEQQKTSAASDPDACAKTIARAAADATPDAAYQAALCYLQGDGPDLVAAKAWLARASELNHLPARRALHALQIAEAASHSPLRHCHDLGEGRQICHGGARPAAAAAAK